MLGECSISVLATKFFVLKDGLELVIDGYFSSFIVEFAYKLQSYLAVNDLL